MIERIDCPYLQALLELLLLLVDDAESEVNFIGLLEVRLHAHDLGEGFFSVLQRPISVIENAYAIPQFGFLNGSQLVVLATGGFARAFGSLR